ncbi:MAG: hypothetical protein AAF982_06890, partial [Pseudomonadota bacterium]
SHPCSAPLRQSQRKRRNGQTCEKLLRYPFFFWLVEGTWKVNQQCFYGRVWQIERAFREGEAVAALQIATQWSSKFEARKEV